MKLQLNSKTPFILLTLVASLLFCPAAGFSQAGLKRVNNIGELNLKASQVQFKNRATGQWIILQTSPGGGGYLVAGESVEPNPWVFYQGAGAAAYNVEIKRGNFLAFNWSVYRQKADETSGVAWNHGKRHPNNTTPAPPHQWTVVDAGGGFFRLSTEWGHLEIVPGIIDAVSNKLKLITRTQNLSNQHQEWEIFQDVIITPKVYNPAAEITFNNNPFGPWDLGYGTVGGDWNRLDKYTTKGTGGCWNASNEEWKGVYFNPGATDIVLSGGFVVKKGMLVMHPGNKLDHLAKIRFTAPEDGNYKVNVNWTAIDDAAKKSSVWVLTNASSVNGAANTAMKEVFTKGISGFNGSASYEGTMTMKKGQQIYFEVGNGGDTYSDDALEIKLTITK